MSYSLANEDGGKGIRDAIMLSHIRLNEDDEVEQDIDLLEPTVGWRLKLDSLTHWFITSMITKIISKESTEAYDEVVFKTENSTYIWREYK